MTLVIRLKVLAEFSHTAKESTANCVTGGYNQIFL